MVTNFVKSKVSSEGIQSQVILALPTFTNITTIPNPIPPIPQVPVVFNGPRVNNNIPYFSKAPQINNLGQPNSSMSVVPNTNTLAYNR